MSAGARSRVLVRVLLVLLLLLAVAGLVASRWLSSDPSRSTYCRIVDCSDLVHLDRLCSMFAESELLSAADPLSAVKTELDRSGDSEARALLDELLAEPRAARGKAVEDAAAARGGRGWQCPAMARVLTSSAAP